MRVNNLKLKTGNKVSFSSKFLKCYFDPSNPLVLVSGTITKIIKYGADFSIAYIKVNEVDEEGFKTNVNNLSKAV